MRLTVRSLAVMGTVFLLASCSSGADNGAANNEETGSPAAEATGEGDTGESTPPTEVESLSVTVYPGSLISFPAQVAVAEGFFESNGLDVNLVEVQGGPAATTAVVSGSADIQLNSTDNNMQTRREGIDMIAVAGNTVSQIFSLLVREGVETPNLGAPYPEPLQDLAGLRVGVTQRGASVETVTRVLLEQGGLDPDSDVTWVAVGTPSTAIPAMTEGEIDAYLAFEPMQTQMVTIDETAKIVVDLREGLSPDNLAESIDWDYNQWAALRENVESRPEAFERFQAAMQETYQFIADSANFERLVEIGLESVTDNEEVVRAMLEDNIETFGYAISQSGVENTANFLVENGLLEEPIAYEEYVHEGARE